MRKHVLSRGWRVAFVAVAGLATSMGCGGSDDPVNVAGTYTLNIVNGANGCMLESLNDTRSGQASITVTQDAMDPRKVTIKINDLLGALVALTVGSDTFVGEVEGRTINARLVGRQTTGPGACTESLILDFAGALSGDALAGTLRYSYQTNKSADCGNHNTCNSVQDFNGTRPPQVK